MYHKRLRNWCRPSLSVTSASDIAFGKSCLLANTSKQQSRVSSSHNTYMKHRTLPSLTGSLVPHSRARTHSLTTHSDTHVCTHHSLTTTQTHNGHSHVGVA